MLLLKRLFPYVMGLCLLASAGMPMLSAPAAAQGGDWPIPGGHFYTQSAQGQGGFSVVDDSEARFWSEFNRLGGLQTVGYPISRRFVYDGFVTQAFQKLVLQWRPEVNQAWPMNVFDELSRHGFDDTLLSTRQTPHPLQNFDPPGATWGQIVVNRQALLDANPAIKARYFSLPDSLNVFGLPVSRVEDMGNHYAVRTQRAVFQQWKETVPWAAAGEVTIANGGDIGKELGWLSGPALLPEATPGAEPPPDDTWGILSMVLGPGTPGRLYALQYAADANTSRLMLSDDLGVTWRAWQNGLPVGGDGCAYSLTMDYAGSGTLYLISCQGLWRWSGSAWERVGDEGYAVTPGNPQQLWSYDSSDILLSEDGGSSWGSAAANLNGGTMGFGTPGQIVVAQGTPPTAYAVLAVGRSGATILRAAPHGSWTMLPEPAALLGQMYSVQLDRSSGALFLSVPLANAIWRIPNPAATPVEQVWWEEVASLDSLGYASVHLLASGWSPQGSALFANFLEEATQIGDGSSVLHRSLDGGRSWEAIHIP